MTKYILKIAILMNVEKLKPLVFLSTLLIFNFMFSQSKCTYLKANRYDLRSELVMMSNPDFKIVGFGAYHGSAKTEVAELLLLKSLIKNHQIKYYLPETDYSIAHYFNEYLKTGDTLRLRQLIHHYGKRVDQERTVEVFKKWKALKQLNDGLDKDQKIEVLGIDPIASYAITAKHLMSLIENPEVIQAEGEFQKLLKVETNNYTKTYNEILKNTLETLAEHYEAGLFKNNLLITDGYSFNHIVKNVIASRDSLHREQGIYNNYIDLADKFEFQTKKQFLRFGFFHIEKEREYDTASFFTKLIENKVYSKNEVVSIIGYLTRSRVLWDTVRDEDEKYVSHNTKGGYGIGDYWKEYFQGIKYLKRNKRSDLTLFQLNKSDSPYHSSYGDLIEVRSFFRRPAKATFKNKATTSFLDYALLIRNSQPNTPLE